MITRTTNNRGSTYITTCYIRAYSQAYRNGTRVRHQRALPHRRIGAALDRIRSSGANTTIKLALEMLVLTACRSGEVRRARWSEFDLKSKIWTIPEERTKSGREHRVPLSSGTLKVLDLGEGAWELATGLVFPGIARTAAGGRNAVATAPPSRDPLCAPRDAVVVPGLVLGDRGCPRGCGGITRSCREEQGGGGLRPVGPAGAAGGRSWRRGRATSAGSPVTRARATALCRLDLPGTAK